ncbi:MAG: hypothetical protein OXP69_13620 [Spirochaetaceae bacterium]|nr:hypothetical protein [Spirochaetaceae bacterium]
MIAPDRILVTLADGYARWRGVSLWRVGHLAAGRGSFFVDLRDGRRHCQTNTYSRVLQWFSDHWPADLAWPGEVTRPAPLSVSVAGSSRAAGATPPARQRDTA